MASTTQNTHQHNNSNSSMLVALMPPAVAMGRPSKSTAAGPTFEILHHLPDPSTGEITRPFLLMEHPPESHDSNNDAIHTNTTTTTTLYEITAVQSPLNDYQSFAVVDTSNTAAASRTTSTVLANGILHTVTPVDPLFWVLWAHNNHDANFLTFHRIHGFRDRTMRDSVEITPAPVVPRP